MVRSVHGRGSSRGSRGFAIVEIMIAVAILTIVAIGIAGSPRAGTTAATMGIESTAALTLLDARLDQIRAAPASSLDASDFRVQSSLLPQALGWQRARHLEPGLVEITVGCRWRSRADGRLLERELATWIATGEER